MSTNRYSPLWRRVFADTIDPVQTRRETEFVLRQLRIGRVWSRTSARERPRVLDVACGNGRHARELVRLGCHVVGVDNDPAAIAAARSRDPQGLAAYRVVDARDLSEFTGQFDAVLCLWQSFGHLGADENQQCLAQFAAALDRSDGEGGIVILDVYHRGFFERHVGSRRFERGGVSGEEVKTMEGSRLTVRLTYDGAPDAADVFSWIVHTPEELIAMGRIAGIAPRLVCGNFDEAMPATPDSPRLQIVFDGSRRGRRSPANSRSSGLRPAGAAGWPCL